mgnify:CR=1 FL=1
MQVPMLHQLTLQPRYQAREEQKVSAGQHMVVSSQLPTPSFSVHVCLTRNMGATRSSWGAG